MIKPHEYPVVGTWYINLAEKTRFEIVAKDEEAGLLEIQYFSGEIEEIDLDMWFEMPVASIAAPKDWSGPYEIDEKDEFPNLEEEIIHPQNRSDPPFDLLE